MIPDGSVFFANFAQNNEFYELEEPTYAHLGTIIRVADWFGVGAIWCSPDTADCWNPKVVQATLP